MNDLQSLISDRLTAIEAARQRQERRQYAPNRFCYVGVVKSGEMVDYPAVWQRQVVTIKEGDERPENTIIYAWSWRELLAKFENMTIRMGPNVWRWK